MSQSNIPKWADRFLEWYCRPELLEEIQGDLYELFEITEQQSSTEQARRSFTWNVFRSFRLSTIKKISLQMPFMPIKSHFKIAYRQLWKQKYHTFINTFGLALGFACCLLIGLYINHELSYDTLHPKSDQLYRLLTFQMWDGEEDRGIYHNPPLAELLTENIPEIENAFRVKTTNSRLVKSGPNAQNSFEEHLIFADQQMLELFYFPLKYGNKNTALQDPFTVVLTEEKAEKYFGKTNPVGQQIFLNNNIEIPFQVTGVIEETDGLSHLQYDFYLSMTSLDKRQLSSWRQSSFPTYLVVSKGSDKEKLESKILELASLHKKDLAEDGISYELQPVKDAYLKSEKVTSYGHWLKGNPQYLWLFGTIALITLFVAVINFVNLSTARSANRAKEVGIRKIIGSNKTQLITQFLVESVLQSIIAVSAGLILVRAAIPFFEQLSGIHITFPWNDYRFLLICLGASILIGVLAGLYPAFYLSNFAPITPIKNQSNKGAKGRLQWGLVACQFITSFVLIFSTILIYRQMTYIYQKNLGFDREQVIVLEDTYSLGENKATFKEQLQQIADIESVALSSYLPVDGYRLNGSSFQHPDTSLGKKEVELRRWYIDEGYIPTLGMQLKEGRNFFADLSLDTSSIILNEAAVDMLGFEDPLNRSLTINRKTYNVVGVVEDFHFRSMKQEILPLAFHSGRQNRMTSTIIKARTNDYEPLVAQIKNIWSSFVPDQALRYSFLDERFNQMYISENRVGITFLTFTLLAIIIASLGLLALTSFIAENRRKELSIRKVLGASVGNLFQLQTQLFGRLLIIAFFIGTPLAYYLMQQWLNDFAYRVHISWDIIALSMALTFILVAITVSYQALRMANVKPVDALRGE